MVSMRPSHSPIRHPDVLAHRGRGARVRGLLIGLMVLTHANAHAQVGGAADEPDPATAAIHFYQRHLSALRHAHCRFTPSCSEYAVQAIATYGLVEGSARAADRLMRCNAAAARFYPRGQDGRLDDPVDAAHGTLVEARVPRWLLPEPEPLAPPVPTTMDSARRVRLDETVAFALRLEQRGDCERASTEYQRAASLAGAAETDSWAFARIGECGLTASQWSAAERAFLTSGMLATTPAGRARALYRTAVSRFDAGGFAACERVLVDPALAAPAAASTPVSVAGFSGPVAAVPPDRVAALTGLCALARGDWSRASGEFERAAARAPDDASRVPSARLQPFAAQGTALPHRSPGMAGALSAVIPGAGQVYSGRTEDGLRHLVFNAALIWTVATLARDDHWPAAYLVTGIAVPFYVGNVLGAKSAARQFDRTQRIELLQRAIRDSAR